MQFTVAQVVMFSDLYRMLSYIILNCSQVYNASSEIEKASSYPLIRLFTAALKDSPVPLDELMEVEQPWSLASPSRFNTILFFCYVSCRS